MDALEQGCALVFLNGFAVISSTLMMSVFLSVHKGRLPTASMNAQVYVNVDRLHSKLTCSVYATRHN